MEYFVERGSIVRKIWGKGDTILFIFAGASSEFALNKAVDWLYFTGHLPSDPLGRLFSTVSYAKKIVFSEKRNALQAIDTIVAIHGAVETKRGFSIPQWAYRDVLYMLIYYSIESYELLERKLSNEEKEEVYHVFYRMGTRMGIKELPVDYGAWLIDRENHLHNDLVKSDLTVDLYKQYRKHLGFLRYMLLCEAQVLVVPRQVGKMLKLGNGNFIRPTLKLYKFLKLVRMDRFLKSLILPSKYIKEINELDEP